MTPRDMRTSRICDIGRLCHVGKLGATREHPIPVLMQPTTLRELRKSAGLSQDDIAQIIGVTSPTVSRMERGVRTINLDQAAAWVEACGARLAVLRTEDDWNAITADLTERERQILRNLLAVLPTLHEVRLKELEGLISVWAKV